MQSKLYNAIVNVDVEHSVAENQSYQKLYFLSALLVQQEQILWQMNLTGDMLWDEPLLAGLLLESASQGVIFHCVVERIGFPACKSEKQLKKSSNTDV